MTAISIEEAERVLKVAYPKDTPTITKTPKGSYKITDLKGNLIGAAFDLKTACRQAVQPVLKNQAARMVEEQKAKEQEFRDFMEFLREKHNAEFDGWRDARRLAAEAAEADAPVSEPKRDEPDQEQLVHLA
jgi:choline dehydrogenase-like flavoprotein